MSLQEEGIVLIMLLDAAERLGSIPGAKPLPAKSPHRRRGHMLPGSCGYMRPLPPGPGADSVLTHSCLLPTQYTVKHQQNLLGPCNSTWSGFGVVSRQARVSQSGAKRSKLP